MLIRQITSNESGSSLQSWLLLHDERPPSSTAILCVQHRGSAAARRSGNRLDRVFGNEEAAACVLSVQCRGRFNPLGADMANDVVCMWSHISPWNSFIHSFTHSCDASAKMCLLFESNAVCFCFFPCPFSSLWADEPWHPRPGQLHRLHVSGEPPDSGRRHAHSSPLHPALAGRDTAIRLPYHQPAARRGRLHPDGPPTCLSEWCHHASGVGVQLAEVHPFLRLRFR